MNPGTGLDCLARWIGVLAIVLIAPTTQAGETEGYSFAAAAQELSQLLWLAETANACGWASREEVLKFERFSLRFLAAHLSEQPDGTVAGLTEVGCFHVQQLQLNRPPLVAWQHVAPAASCSRNSGRFVRTI